MAPYVNQNWKLSTELWKLESMISLMDNLLVYEEKGVADKWYYRLRQGAIECNYKPFIDPSSTTTSTTLPPSPPTVAPLAPAKPGYEQDYNEDDYEMYKHTGNEFFLKSGRLCFVTCFFMNM